MIDFDTAFTRVIGVEMGYVNDPNDPGGETKYGISKRSYPHINIGDLTLAEAKAIYLHDFWDVLVGVHPAVKFQLFDFAVNSGMGNAIRKLQLAVQVPDDGQWGPGSVAAYEATELNDVLLRLIAYRLLFMTNAKNWPADGRGWARRIANDLLFAAGDN